MKSRRNTSRPGDGQDQFGKWVSQWEKAQGIFEDAPKPHVPTPQYGPEDFYGNFNPAAESDIRDVDAEYWSRVSGAVNSMEDAPDPHKMFDDEGNEYEFVPDPVEVFTENVEPVAEVTKEEFRRMRVSGLTEVKSLGKVNATLAEWVDARRGWLDAKATARDLITKTMPEDWKIKCESVEEALDKTARTLLETVYRLTGEVFQGSSPYAHKGFGKDRYPLKRWLAEAKQYREATTQLKLATARSAKEWGVRINEAKKELFTPVTTDDFPEDTKAATKDVTDRMFRSPNPIQYPSVGKDQRPHVTPFAGGKRLAEVERVKRELEKLEVRAHSLFARGKMSEGRKALKKLETFREKVDELSDLLAPDPTNDQHS